MSWSRAGRHCEWALQWCPVHEQEAKRCTPYRVSTKKWEEQGLTGIRSIEFLFLTIDPLLCGEMARWRWGVVRCLLPLIQPSVGAH